MGWGLLKSLFKFLDRSPAPPFLLRIHAFDFAAASSPRTRDWPGCASWLLGWSVWPVVQTKNIFNIGIQCSYYWSWNVILWQVLWCCFAPTLEQNVYLWVTCQETMGDSKFISYCFPIQRRPPQRKSCKKEPPGGGSFLSVFLFLGNGKQTGKFQMEPCSYHWGAVTWLRLGSLHDLLLGPYTPLLQELSAVELFSGRSTIVSGFRCRSHRSYL